MLRTFFVLCLSGFTTLQCQNVPHPLTQVEACRAFRHSIVRVDTDTMHGTGFIVSPDGWIITALHVVADQKTLVKYGSLSVSMHGRSIPAEVMSPLDKLAQARDFAILKIDNIDLPSLDLGSEVDIEDGSEIAIIGLPLSAMAGAPIAAIPSFCLAGTVAAQIALPLGNLQFRHTIYFQGISIKGISGAPIISLVTGKVIGIVSTRLTGIGNGLANLRDEITAQSRSIQLGNFRPIEVEGKIVDVLDEQLANGLGSGTGASDVAVALDETRREYERQHPKKPAIRN